MVTGCLSSFSGKLTGDNELEQGDEQQQRQYRFCRNGEIEAGATGEPA
ncbi:MAG: hypothetical protein MZV63_67055 [Marinilabiliales bacterium]|nr:hypothetical protein [Marinilabiliales bacterium]